MSSILLPIVYCILPDHLAGESSTTPLINSMTYGSFSITKQLLDAKADPKVARQAQPAAAGRRRSEAWGHPGGQSRGPPERRGEVDRPQLF